MKRSAGLSLLLLVPAPSIGVLFGMILLPGTPAGQGIFIFSKVWIFLLPAMWFLVVEKEKPRRGRTGKGGLAMGLSSGLLISGFIFLGWSQLGMRMIDPARVRTMAAEIGLDRKTVYLGGALYWVLINSVLEEYVWRWFVVRQCRRLMRPFVAVVVSALAFTLHHILALQVYFSPVVTALCALGIFLGGALWSWMVAHYRTIWPGWVSHILVDITIFGIGYVLIFS